MVEFAEESLLKEGLCGLLMTQLSRTIGTEAVFADNDLEMHSWLSRVGES